MQMNYIQGTDRHQSALFPQVLDDYIGADNPVRFIDAYVDQLDLKALGFTHATGNATGRPPYRPGDLLKLYVYGYLNKTRSSRLLEKATQRNVELMWLLQQLTPDFKTIADFRKDNLASLKKVCRDFILLCKELDLFGCELVAIDGSKFAAVNHTSRTYTRKRLERKLGEIDKKVADYFTQLEREDQNEARVPCVSANELKERITNLQAHKARLAQIQQDLEKSGELQVSLTDPDSRMMVTTQGGTDICYNVQFAVDAKHKLIVDFEVTNDVNDQQQLAHMAHQAKETLGVDRLSVVADMGYYKEEELKQCSDEQITCYVPEPNKSNNKRLGLFTKKEFRYDAENDCYLCPANERLIYRNQCLKSGKQMRFYEGTVCTTCTMRSRCTRTNNKNRRIQRWVHGHIIDELQQRMREHPEMMKRRRETVEHPFGTMKRWMEQKYFLLRGKLKVSAEMSLTILAYNMKRVMNILGIEELIKILQHA